MRIKIILLLITILVVTATGAFAARPFPNEFIDAGTRVGTPGSTLKYDIKGQPVIGVASSGATTLYIGAGYAIWEVAGEWVPLEIERNGLDIVLTWPTTISSSVYIYYKDGNGSGEYTTGENLDWLQLAQVGGGIYTYTDVDAASWLQQPPEKYYKAFSGPNPAPEDFRDADGVGKLTYEFEPGKTFFNYPFTNTNTSVDVLFGGQGYANGSQVLVYNKGVDAFDNTEIQGGVWANPFPLDWGASYIFLNQSTSAISPTLVGSIPSPNTYVFQLPMLPGKTFVGLPLPIMRTVQALFGSTAGSGDGLLIYDKAQDSYATVNYDHNLNQFEDPNYEMRADAGYLYLRSGLIGFDWEPAGP
jgi:hypothetical protein